MSKFKTILEPAAVTCASTMSCSAAHECEFALNIGLFFDGTGNNKNVEPSATTNTNVVRLWEAYRDKPDEGYFAHYVSGVGTPFTEIGEAQPPATGGPFGAGGEARIVYGLLQVINSVHSFINHQKPRFDDKQLAALCSETSAPRDSYDGSVSHPPSPQQKLLTELGLDQGLVSAGDRSFLGTVVEGPRRKFFNRIVRELGQQVQARATRPKISAVHIDVFGFSRGAAQARVFVSWLHELLLMDGHLFGAESQVRMLGLFDTVASVGITDAAGGHGHSAWASADNLRILPEVKNCVHIVAMHELRSNFPSDSVARGGKGDNLAPNCHEHHCPGVHSDVGGGYGPGEQGKGVRLERNNPLYVQDGMRLVPDDQLRLSSLPLNHMYEAARQVCEGHEAMPWIALESQTAKDAGLPARFGLDRLAAVRQSVEQYFALCGVPEGLNTFDALRQHGLRYLAWRYGINEKNNFETLASVQRAVSTDPKGLKHYRKGQEMFERQVRLLSTPQRWMDSADDKAMRNGRFPHADEIFQDMKALKVNSAVGTFFDEWVHDSYASFIAKFVKDDAAWWGTLTGGIEHKVAEGQGYVRWRQVYEGSDDGLNASLPQNWGPGANQRRVA